jgi:hypothetical protein
MEIQCRFLIGYRRVLRGVTCPFIPPKPDPMRG